MIAPEPRGEVERIAVLRANDLGDLVFALPALEALRVTYPDAEITLLAKEWHRELLGSRAGPVDRVIAVPAHRGVREDREPEELELESFFAAMAAERFDVALQMHGGGRFSNAFVARLGARITAGARTPDAPALDRSITYVYLQPEVLRQLEIVGLVGAPPAGLEPRLAVTDEDRGQASAHVAVDGPLVVLQPGASDPRRRWPVERFAAVGDALAASGAAIVVNGDGSERALAAELAGSMRAPVRDLSGLLSLGGLTGVLARARLVVSNDSGPLHLAAAVGAPTVGIYWGPSAINGMLAARRDHRPLVSFTLACPRCGADSLRSPCDHADSHVADVPVDEVVAAAQHLLGAEVDDAAALQRALDPRAG
ncbi:MAG: glycosyltransferase family 9 protein [Thermoleophilaceae bacterium]|nr:glycosyltransferase family 9 protein [Thermoleophilaceae bacterium]